MHFTQPAAGGDILKFSSKIIHAGTTSITTHISVRVNHSKDTIVNGFITFVHVDENNKPFPHSIVMELETEEDKILSDNFKALIL